MADLQKEQQAGAEAIESSELDRLLNGAFRVQDNQEASAVVQGAVRTLVQQALESAVSVSDDTVETIKAIIAQLDEKLSAQVNLIMHHEDFTKLEGSWRGLHHLVSNSETDEQLQIRVLNISKDELGKVFKKYKGKTWDQSPMYKKLYGAEYDVLGGYPYGCVVGDYEFDHTPPSVAILQGMMKIAAAAHAPFIAAAGSKLLGMDSWREVNDPADLSARMRSPEYAGWRALRESDDSRYVGLAMPRFLSRLPYDPEKNPVEEFEFQEDVSGADHDRYVWSNSAYAMAANINRSFKRYGWCTCIRGVENGGTVEGLPVHTFQTDEGGIEMKCPTEVAIGDRREAELSKAGLLPLLHRKNTTSAVFIGAQSLQAPQEYDDPDATNNAQLSARLPYLFAVSRFAHYLKCIVRDKVGTFKERDDMEKFLNNWIAKYVAADAHASDDVKARYPLAEAHVEVAEVEGNPGYYASKFYLRPHYQLEGLSVSLRLTSKLPSVKGGS